MTDRIKEFIDNLPLEGIEPTTIVYSNEDGLIRVLWYVDTYDLGDPVYNVEVKDDVSETILKDLILDTHAEIRDDFLSGRFHNV